MRLSPLKESGTSDLADSGGVISSCPLVWVTPAPICGGSPRLSRRRLLGGRWKSCSALAQDGGDHVLGNGVLGTVNLHVAGERAVGLYEPCV